MGRLRRLPLTMFDRSEVAGHQSLALDQLTYRDLASQRQQRANDTVREKACFDSFSCGTAKLSPFARLCQVPNSVAGNWAWLYITTSAIFQGTMAGTDAKVL